MANCVDFNRKYKFKLSHSNDIDRYASVIDEEIENYLGELNEEECNEPEELILTKKDLIGKLDLSSFKPQKELNPKIYGVIVSKGQNRGLLLPDLEGVDTVEEQLNIACQKGGINPNSDNNIEKFEVIRYKEGENNEI